MSDRERADPSLVPEAPGEDRPTPDMRTDWGAPVLLAGVQVFSAAVLTWTAVAGDLGIVGVVSASCLWVSAVVLVRRARRGAEAGAAARPPAPPRRPPT